MEPNKTEDGDELWGIHSAVKSNRIEVVAEELRQKKNVNKINDNGETPLHIAADLGKVDIAKILLEASADVEAKNYEGNTPLYVAARRENLDLVRILIEAGSDVNTENYHQVTPLIVAIFSDFLDIMKLLIEAGADVNAKVMGTKLSMLHLACAFSKKEETLKLLIDAGADVHAADEKGHTVLHEACKTDKIHFVKLLIDAGANVKTKNSITGYTPLLWVVSSTKSVNILKLLIDMDADVNDVGKNNETALHMAIMNTNFDFIKVLLDAGAKVDAAGPSGLTVLHFAAATASESLETFRLLLSAGADANAKCEDGNSPLHLAVRFTKNCKIIKLLLDAKADISARNNHGHTPFFMAILYSQDEISKLQSVIKSKVSSSSTQSKNINVLKLLIDHGADPNAVDSSGTSPLSVAAYLSKHADILKLLIDSGANVNQKNYDGNTPIFCTVDRNNLTNTKLLIDAGANVNVTNKLNQNLLQVAACLQNTKMLKLLLQTGANPSQLTQENNEVSFRFFVRALDLIILDKILQKVKVEETIRLLVQGIDINLVDSKGYNILTAIVNTSFHFTSEEKLIFGVIFEHAALLIALGLKVKTNLITSRSGVDSDIFKHFLNCEKELERAKNTRLNDSWVTFFDLLTNNECALVKYAGRESSLKDFGKNIKNFPIYGTKIQNNLLKGIDGRNLLNKAANTLNHHLPILNPTHLVINDILYSLSPEDWKKISDRKRRGD